MILATEYKYYIQFIKIYYDKYQRVLKTSAYKPVFKV